MSLPDEIRAACARVAGAARHVRIVDAAIPPYALRLPAESPPAPDLEPGASDEQRAAFGLQLNAVNFGSGWFPTLRKPDGLSGFRTVEAGLKAARAVDRRGAHARRRRRGRGHVRRPGSRARADGAVRARAATSSASTSWREHGGSFLALARCGDGSAVRARRAAGERCRRWLDVSPYDGARVPFFKRAQLAAADLHLQGIAPAADVAALTLFADNLVPHVLRIDGVLEFDARARRADRRAAS